MAANAKRCHDCAARRKRIKDCAFSAARRARIRRKVRPCLWPGCTVNLRGTRARWCVKHALERRNMLRRDRYAAAVHQEEFREEDEMQAVTPWSELVRSAWES